MTKFIGSTGLTYLWSKIKSWVQSTFVSDVSINGNNVRVTKNGSNTDLTVPYATKTTSIEIGYTTDEDAIASETGVVRISRISNGIPSFPTTNNANVIVDVNTYDGKYNHQLGFSSDGHIYHRRRNGATFGEWVELVRKDDDLPEAYLKWGGKNLDNAYSPVDAAMINELGADRSAFLHGQHVDIEYSRDDGTTWTDYGATDAQKGMLFSNGTIFTIGKPASGTVSDAHCQLRITINTANASFYSKLNKFALYITTSGSSGCWCSIDVKLQQNITNNIDTWVNRCNKASISGWSGWNIINIADITTYGNQPASQYGQIRFTFGCTSYTGNGTTQQGLGVQKIRSFGGVGWFAPSNMAKNGHLYSWDDHQTMITPASIRPVVNNTHMCGNSSYRWSNVYSVLGNFSGMITASGGITVPSGKTITVDGKEVLTTHQDVSSLVPNTRKVNNKTLNADITLTASDVGADALIYDIDASSLDSSGEKAITSTEPYNAINTAFLAGKAVYVRLINFNTRMMDTIIPLVSTNFAPYTFMLSLSAEFGGFFFEVDVYQNSVELACKQLNFYSVPNGGIPKNHMAQAVQTSLDKADNAQAQLVSGTNIKTVNNESLLGSGNLDISIDGSYIAYPSFNINNNGHLIMTDGAEGLFTIENGHLKYNF